LLRAFALVRSLAGLVSSFQQERDKLKLEELEEQQDKLDKNNPEHSLEEKGSLELLLEMDKLL